jgi:hypothetical protein
MTISHIWVRVNADPNEPLARRKSPRARGCGVMRYFERFLGLCWFSVEVSDRAEAGMGTAP